MKKIILIVALLSSGFLINKEFEQHKAQNDGNQETQLIVDFSDSTAIANQ